MKDGLNALYERRSVRKYKSEQISDGELEQILKAGLCAPSAMNRQPAIIIAVQDKDTIAYMSNLLRAVYPAGADTELGCSIHQVAEHKAPILYSVCVIRLCQYHKHGRRAVERVAV